MWSSVGLALIAARLPSITQATPEMLERNFAYRSPYANQPGLSLDTHSIHKRQFQAGEQIRREHHHLQNQKRDNAGSGGAPKPDGEDGTYLYTGTKAQTANHANAPYVYAGQLNFTHSVASGDPYDTSVLLWTRVEPVSDYELHIPMCVRYKVYEDEQGEGEPVTAGYALTNVDVDFTVKVEAEHLEPGTWYWYQFAHCVDDDNVSPMGRTKTAPGYKATDLGTQRFSVFSCSNFPEGFFSAYSGPVLHDDTDYVIHLGDYIYEYGTAGTIGRNASKGTETATLDDYRKRYAQYRTDEDLVEMHRLFPIIAVWDDHETANNDWKAGSSNSNDSIATNGCAFSNDTVCFTERAINAKRAYHEWIPLRQVDLQDEGRIWREFNFGNLIDLFALDTRKYDRDVTDVGWNSDYIRQVQFDMESDRSITGMKQERWLLDGLYDSQERGSHWRLLLNQVQFGSCDETFIFTEPQDRISVIPTDSWNGYQAQRLRIIREIYDNQIDNVAIVTGDSHSNWMYEITESTSWRGDPDPSQIRQITETSNSYQRGQIVEYAGTAVSSNGWGSRFGDAENATLASARGVEENGALLYSEGFQRGYMHLAVNYTHLVTTYFAYPGTRQARVADNRTEAVQFVQENGYNQVQRPLPQPRQGGFGAVKPGN